MSNNRRVTLKGNQNIIVEFTNERIIPAGEYSCAVEPPVRFEQSHHSR